MIHIFIILIINKFLFVIITPVCPNFSTKKVFELVPNPPKKKRGQVKRWAATFLKSQEVVSLTFKDSHILQRNDPLFFFCLYCFHQEKWVILSQQRRGKHLLPLLGRIHRRGRKEILQRLISQRFFFFFVSFSFLFFSFFFFFFPFLFSFLLSFLLFMSFLTLPFTR